MSDEDKEENKIHEIRRRNKEFLKSGIRTNPAIAKIAEKAHYEPAELTDFDRQYVRNWLQKRINQYENKHNDYDNQHNNNEK